ncbi:MAG: FkbM family methyltransferase [Parachlamydiaceae bacterium]|nr:FkbM family methyltransferase [Parachlamydiaceae bacterium]
MHFLFGITIALFSLFIHPTCCAVATQSPKDSSLFMGVVIKENDGLIPYFLRTLDNLKYDKQNIHLQVNVYNTSDHIQYLVSRWVAQNKQNYKQIIYVDNRAQTRSHDEKIAQNRVTGEIKTDYLRQAKALGCAHCFILSSETFLLPGTLRYLMQKDKPIVAPLLRPIPEPGEAFRNFFAAVSPEGYFEGHPDYFLITYRKKMDTFSVPCVQGAYLIQAPYFDQLSFSKDFHDWEFLAFSKSARDNSIPQYICNEKEFGFFLHFTKEMPLSEEKAFTLGGINIEVDRPLLDKLLAFHLIGDEHLNDYVARFPYDDYAIYRVQNRDLFYVDDVNDYIKSYAIKEGFQWEGQINEEFKKYVKPGTVALDIGGHIGTHALNLSKIVGPGGTVHVFEPQAKMFCELTVNMHLNNCNNVVLHHRALGASEKWVEMYLPNEPWTETFAQDFVNEGHATVTESAENFTGDKVKMVALDSFNLNNVSFIKIDVEGFEMDVIQGGKETIKRNKPTMIVEIFNNAERQSKMQEIESLGYRSSHLKGDDFLFLAL